MQKCPTENAEVILKAWCYAVFLFGLFWYLECAAILKTVAIVRELHNGSIGWEKAIAVMLIPGLGWVKWSQKFRQVNKVDLAFISGRINFRERRRIHDDKEAKDVFGRIQGESGVGGDSGDFNHGGDCLAAQGASEPDREVEEAGAGESCLTFR
jgi:hypothetical protein